MAHKEADLRFCPITNCLWRIFDLAGQVYGGRVLGVGLTDELLRLLRLLRGFLSMSLHIGIVLSSVQYIDLTTTPQRHRVRCLTAR